MNVLKTALFAGAAASLVACGSPEREAEQPPQRRELRLEAMPGLCIAAVNYGSGFDRIRVDVAIDSRDARAAYAAAEDGVMRVNLGGDSYFNYDISSNNAVFYGQIRRWRPQIFNGQVANGTQFRECAAG